MTKKGVERDAGIFPGAARSGRRRDTLNWILVLFKKNPHRGGAFFKFFDSSTVQDARGLMDFFLKSFSVLFQNQWPCLTLTLRCCRPRTHTSPIQESREMMMPQSGVIHRVDRAHAACPDEEKEHSARGDCHIKKANP
jgi:hypothetical protein